jgi:hypothetical protein
MQRKKDLVQVAVWVCCGIIAGALITAGVQSLVSAGRPLQAKQPAGNMAEPAEAVSAVKGAPVGAPDRFASPCPVSDALTALNDGRPVQATNPAAVSLSPGTHYSETASGYPIYTGGRAVDSLPAQIPVQFQQAESQNQVILPDAGQEAQQVGRNGLIANPCVDPPSSHGLAYSRPYN